MSVLSSIAFSQADQPDLFHLLGKLRAAAPPMPANQYGGDDMPDRDAFYSAVVEFYCRGGNFYVFDKRSYAQHTALMSMVMKGGYEGLEIYLLNGGTVGSPGTREESSHKTEMMYIVEYGGTSEDTFAGVKLALENGAKINWSLNDMRQRTILDYFRDKDPDLQSKEDVCRRLGVSESRISYSPKF